MSLVGDIIICILFLGLARFAIGIVQLDRLSRPQSGLSILAGGALPRGISEAKIDDSGNENFRALTSIRRS